MVVPANLNGGSRTCLVADARDLDNGVGKGKVPIC